MNQSALIQDDKEQFQRELEKTDNLLQQYQAEVSQLKDDKKQLKIQLQKIEETARLDQTPTLEEFVSQLEKGTNVVIVASYAIKAIKMSQKKLEQIRFKYSALGAEKFVDSKRKWWVIQLGGFYSKESANILVEKAINELGFPKEGPSKPYIIDIKRTTHRQTEPVFGEAGSQVVIVRTYKSYQEKQAQQEVEKLNDRYPDIEAKKYKKDEKWLVYIGNSSSLKSAEVLKSWAHEHIANDAYVSKK
ncbi:MAG: hypothetical protein DRR16_25230 [Candidatus Parabeggiatoa sp. nov. 3]|nr:MAG: hypothetical protein DRR16_25230 [Gammaproteobacteria bacterium]